MNVDYSKKWFVMSATAAGIFLSTIDGSIVNIALNTLVESLHEPLAVIEWVVLAYLLVNATLMLSIGRLADMIGKKKIFIAGMTTFTLGSAFCGLSPNVSLLITSRVIQAMGAAMMMAVGMAITTEAFPPQDLWHFRFRGRHHRPNRGRHYFAALELALAFLCQYSSGVGWNTPGRFVCTGHPSARAGEI